MAWAYQTPQPLLVAAAAPPPSLLRSLPAPGLLKRWHPGGADRPAHRPDRPQPAVRPSLADLCYPLLQSGQCCLGPLQLASEGEIILSSNGSELGCRSIIHAGGAGGIGHSGGGTV